VATLVVTTGHLSRTASLLQLLLLLLLMMMMMMMPRNVSVLTLRFVSLFTLLVTGLSQDLISVFI